MAFEKRWQEVPERELQQDGGADGSIVLESTSGFKVKQKVKLQDNSSNIKQLEVKRVDSPTVLFVGEVGKSITDRSDISNFTTSNQSKLSAQEQAKNEIPSVEHELAVYEREPTVAKRVVNVDKYGRMVDKENPLDVRLSDGSIYIGSVEGNLEVQLSRKDKVDGAPHDSVRVGNQDVELDYTNEGDGLGEAKVHDQDTHDAIAINNDLYQRVLPVLTNANFLKTANYDSIVQTFNGNTATLSYREDGFEIAKVDIRFANAQDWDIDIKRYILDDDGSKLLDDDDQPLLLE